ncbi:MAG: UDP-N-acetylmuramoyl-L-alanine--D-glutamate ligase [Solirubrobacteraceae bacterium]
MKGRSDMPPGPFLVVGLARSGIAAALTLRAREEEAIGVDAGRPDGLDVLASAGVELHVGEQGVDLLDRVSTVVKSPGVPARAPVIARARERGVCVMGELELAWRLLANEFIAVTGTNGKTTTVELIGHIHRVAGLPVAVAGNVGTALSGLVGKIAENVTVVCEASSFQLEDTLAFAPEAAVLLNLAPDHLDRHGTFDAYRQAKLELFVHQGPADVAVAPSGYEPEGLPGRAHRVSFGDEPVAQMSVREGMLYWEGQPLLNRSELSLRGRHNLENAMAAAAVCLVRGLDSEAVKAGLRSFAGVPHRLEEVARREGVLYVNDSKATNVASTLVALETMAQERLPVHLILGGQGKAQDFSPLSHAVRSCRAVYLIGEDAPLIAHALQSSGVPLYQCDELERAVTQAAATAREGEVVLLSPGCASFDQFVDFEARGETFKGLVIGL